MSNAQQDTRHKADQSKSTLGSGRKLQVGRETVPAGSMVHAEEHMLRQKPAQVGLKATPGKVSEGRRAFHTI